MLRKTNWLLALLAICMVWTVFTTTKYDALAKSKEYEVGSYIVNNTDTFLFNEANTHEGSKCELPEGTLCTVLENDHLFTKVQTIYGGEVGYLYQEYIGYDAEKVAAYEAELLARSEEIRYLAALIQCEAGGEPVEGMVAVGAVVMNRVKSAGYPNTILEVVTAPGQFSPADSTKMATLFNENLIKDICREAAIAAYQGVDNTGGATHFRRKGSKDGLVIGNQVFY